MYNAEKNEVCEKVGASKGGVVNIDSNLRDPQMCGLYAPDIYNNKRVTEVGGAIFIHLMPIWLSYFFIIVL